MAITSLIIATATGIVLLLWYRPSVHLAHASVEGMMVALPWTAGLLRSLHRYSSDVAMFFALVHALRVFLERRFTGARWLAWVTGVAAVITLWFVGWTGYWLVWDTRAHGVAVGTAKALDVLPIFADPMGRSFLTDSSLNSLLFFVVFFLHMLVPLAMGVFLWLHIARLSRARFLTKAPLTVWVTGAMILLSIVYPADTEAPARMTAIRDSFEMDAWYLLPLAFTDRLGGGALWAILILGALGDGHGPLVDGPAAARPGEDLCGALQRLQAVLHRLPLRRHRDGAADRGFEEARPPGRGEPGQVRRLRHLQRVLRLRGNEHRLARNAQHPSAGGVLGARRDQGGGSAHPGLRLRARGGREPR